VAVAAVVMITAACREAGAPPRATPSTARASPTSSTGQLARMPATAVADFPRPSGVVVHGSRSLPLVALTFDTNMTDAMLTELDRHQVPSFVNQAAIDELRTLRVPATLFLASKWVERYPDVTRSLAGDPLFELASHSYAHRPFKAPCYGLGPVLPVRDMAADVEHSEEVLRRFADRPTPYFRFPGGCYDKAALDAIAPTGVVVIQYDVAGGDAFGTSVDAIVSNVLQSTTNGSIVVMHLTGGNTAPLTAPALPRIVAGLRVRGLRLVKLSELLAASASSTASAPPASK
jgi:peptidoglycan/xylan/chitin deacetylase (PgdA/CDA1 family)